MSTLRLKINQIEVIVVKFHRNLMFVILIIFWWLD